MANLFESKTCPRCGGSGHYSYCQSYGTTCFKCAGAKEVLTKRGAEAQRFFSALLCVPVAEVKVGDSVLCEGIPGFTKSHFSKVESITPTDTSGCVSMTNGVETPQRTDLVTFHTAVMTMGGLAPEKLVRVSRSKEFKAAAVAKSLAYQGTLTKAGVPSKKLQSIAKVA